MNNQEFIQETSNYIQDVYKRFELYQNTAKDILLEFDRVCKKCDVRYWLFFGTLIGAIRDQGQVPWDYDVDVVCFYSDMQYLVEALEKELAEDYYYCYNNNTDYYPGGNRVLRVCKKGYSMIAIHVDVFFMFGASSNERGMKKYYKRMMRLKFIYDVKCIPHHYREETKDKPNKIVRKIYESLYGLIPFRLLKLYEAYFLKKYPLKDKVYVGPVFPVSLFETKYVRIWGIDFPIPAGYDIILKNLYGDYNKYPSIESRFCEFYEHTKTIDYIQGKYIQK